ncbi:uncharacterized protein LOC131951863 isoform X2 [Physella acuta]|uniref:uncharacterized protein LOC131951863 isoform X2 n=1 Tax=Physella acuta TaxID=109671 RepID=UPI0027DB157A|nr:uncharacterized protein LOC131951863 isoform X2 [Physella acuta]
MRWADVAKIGCSRDSGARNFTVLVGDVNRTASSDFYKLTSGPRGTENPTPHAAHGEGVKVRADDDSEDWQQVARNAFVDNMSVKGSQKDRSPCTPVSSDCDTDELSSTGSSECPSAASNGLLTSKDPLSIVDDFTLADPTHMSMHKMFPSSFSHFFDESKDKNLFSMDDLGEPKRSSHDIMNKLAAIKDINHHSNDGKHTSSWSWLKDKPLAEYPTSWDITPRSRPLLQTTSGKVQVQSEGEDMEEGNDAQLDDHPRVKLSSKTDFFDDFLPDLDNARFSSMTDDSFFHRFDKTKAGKSTPVFGMLSKKDLYDQDLFELSLLAGDKEAWAGDPHEWGKKEFRMKPESRGFENSWFDRRSDEGATKLGHSDNPGCYMPSFASMAGVLDNNPIVTSVVESVLTAPTVTSLPGLGLPDKQQPTYSNKASVVPSPPPGFNFQKPNPMRALAFDPTLVLYNSQTLLSGKTSNTQDAKNLSSDAQMDFETNRSTDKLIFGATKPRTPMVGVVGPFSNTSTDLSNSDQFHTQRFQNSTLPVFSHAGDFSTGMPSLPVRPTSTHTVFGVPVSSTPIFSGSNAGSNCWQDRTSNVCTVTASNMTSSSSLCATLGDLTARLQPRVSYRISDQQLTLSKRPQDISFRTFQDAVESYQRRQNEQFFLHQQHQQQLMLDRQQQTAQQLLKQYKTAAASWQKPHLNLLQQRQHQLRQFQPRQLSPPVLFPGSLRDEPEPRDGLTLPAFQDNTPTDLLSDLFADPLLVEKIAINQIRQQFWSAQVNNLAKDSISPFRDSVYSNDLEYYASLYRVKIRDVLVGPIQTESSSQAEQTPRVETDRLTLTRASRAQDGRPGSPEREMVTTERCSSRRWRDAINRILDTPWTTRRQYGDIVLPSSLSEYNISHVEYPLVLGLTTDGNEVVVLILDKSQAYIDPCLLDVMCDPEFDHHFILKCKAISETHSSMYVALELCDYTLAEYVHIVQLSHRQDPLSANRLAWQLLEGLKFVHHHLGMPHGNLKPSWIFVDVEGRLRLGGYGIVTRTPEPTTADRNEMVRSACWTSSEDLNTSQPQSSKASDIQVAGMLLYFILTGGQHPFGTTPLEAELNIARSSSQMQHISEEANDLVSGMLFPDPAARPTVEHCLKHPFFWSSEKKFRLILIVGSDVLTEMKTGIALTGNGSPTMMEILSVLDITEVQAINPTVMKEMRSFRVYKNCLSELTLFIYNCCLHFDKMSALAKEVLDDPCKYFQGLFPSLFMAIYRSLKASDRIDRTCYKPFF